MTTLYILVVKHDTGTIQIMTAASSKAAAIDKICKSEGCPQSAIQSVKSITIY